MRVTTTMGFLDAIVAGLPGYTVRGGMQGRRKQADSRLLIRCLCFGLALMTAAAASPAAAAEKGAVTGFPIPRFVSIRVDEANLRVGPDKYFPIRTVLLRKGMPAKVIDEFKLWRKVELYDGMQGWLHQSLITGRRTFLVQKEMMPMRREASEDAAVVARLEHGALAYLEECRKGWCSLSAGGYEGWVPQTSGWGALPGEEFED